MNMNSGGTELLYKVISQFSGQPKSWQSGALSLSNSLDLEIKNIPQNMSPPTACCLWLISRAGHTDKANVLREHIRCRGAMADSSRTMLGHMKTLYKDKI